MKYENGLSCFPTLSQKTFRGRFGRRSIMDLKASKTFSADLSFNFFAYIYLLNESIARRPALDRPRLFLADKKKRSIDIVSNGAMVKKERRSNFLLALLCNAKELRELR